VEATPFGLAVIERAKVIVNEVARSLEEVRAMEGGRIGGVNFGITQNFAHYIVPELLREVMSERPNLQFNVTTGGFLEMIEKVRSGTIDFVFGLLSNVHASEDLTIEVLRDHYSRVVARAAHPLAQKKDVTSAELADARWASLNGEGFQRNFLNFFEASDLNIPSQVIKTDSIDLIRMLIRDQDLLTVLPAAAVKDDMDAGLVKIIDCETPAEATQLCLVFRSSGVVTPQMKLVLDRIRRMVHV
jgi:DNA-binding transcriptional LysR family regulator